MEREQTTAVVQRYLDALAGDQSVEPIMLIAVVERLLKAMRSQRPPTVRQFFGLVVLLSQHLGSSRPDKIDDMKVAE